MGTTILAVLSFMACTSRVWGVPGVCGIDWVCANSSAEASMIPSLASASSCFCVAQKPMTQQDAYTYCSSIGGFLSDIQNQLENTAIPTVLNQMASAFTSSPTLCGPSGFLYNNTTCYTYNATMKMDWWDAEEYCQSTYNGHLASIPTDAARLFIYNNVTKKGTGCDQFGLWVGGTDLGDDKTWVWSDGTSMKMPTLTKNPKWGKQMDNPKRQNCMDMIPFDGGLADWYCDRKMPFVCQFSAPTFYPIWIGLQNTMSGHNWNVGQNCATTPATFLALNASAEAPVNTGYTLGSDGTWTAQPPTFTAYTALCRQDNICGRNPCPSCSTCAASTPANCYTCS